MNKIPGHELLKKLSLTKVVKFFFITFFIFSFFFFNQTEAAVTYQAKGTFASGTGALTVAVPAGYQNGDVFFLFVESANQAVTTPSGWTLIGTQQGTGTAGVTGGVRLAVFYKVVSGTQLSVTVADTGDHTTAIIMNFRGVDTSAPINVSSGSVAAANTAMTFPTATTTVANAGIILAAAMDTDLASTTTVASWANANISSLTEVHDQTVIAGTGGGLAIAAGYKVSAGATGTSTATGSTSVTHAYMTIALKPIPDTWTVSGTSTNTSASGATVRVAINGTLQAQTSTLNCSGNPCTWSVSGITAGSAGSIITAWISSVADDLESTAVTKYSSGTAISGMILDKNTLTIGSNQNTTVSVTNLGLCDFDTGCASEDIMHTSNLGALNVMGSTNSYVDAVLSVLTSNTLTVSSGSSESVTTDRIANSGTITSSSSPTYTLTGMSGTLFANNGTFNYDKSSVILSSNADVSVNSGTLTLFNLTSMGTGEKSLGTSMTLAANGTLEVLNGTFNPRSYLLSGGGTNTLTLASGAILKVEASTFSGNYSAGFTAINLAGGSTVDYSVSGNQTILNRSYYNLNTSGSGTKTLGGATSVSGVLTIGTGTTLAASSYSIDLTQSEGNVPFRIDGTFNAGTGTVSYSNNPNVFLSSGYPTFYNLSIIGAGTRKQAENLAVSNTLTLSGGTLDTSTSNYSINAGNIVLNGGALTPNASIITLTGTGTVFNYTSGTYTPGTSTIKITNTSATGKIFAGGGQTYNNIWYAPGTGTGSLTISGSNTFNNFKDDGTAAHSLLFTTGTTQNIASWTVTGNVGNLITINSAGGTGTHTLNYTGTGTANSDYLNIQHSVATPASTWYAGGNSVNNQAVVTAGSGWVFGVVTLVLEQGSYRFFSNVNDYRAQNPLALTNQVLSLTDNEFRLKMLLGASGTTLGRETQTFNLQYAQKSGTCDTAFTGETYQDVDQSTIIGFNNNMDVNDGAVINIETVDPGYANGNLIAQSYVTSIKFPVTEDILSNSFGLYDFSLRYLGVESQQSYCFRIIKNDGHPLDTYSYMPEIVTPIYRSRGGNTTSVESGATPGTITTGGGTSGGNEIVPPICSDTIDNDSDTLVDTLDPHCHLGGNINNEYISTHNSETIAPVSQTGGGAGDNGGDLGFKNINKTTQLASVAQVKASPVNFISKIFKKVFGFLKR